MWRQEREGNRKLRVTRDKFAQKQTAKDLKSSSKSISMILVSSNDKSFYWTFSRSCFLPILTCTASRSEPKGPGLAQPSRKWQQEDQVQEFAAEEVVQGRLRDVLHVWGCGGDRAFGGGRASWLPAGFTSKADTITVTAGGERPKWHTHTHIYIHMHTYTRINIHIHIYTYIHTCTHIYTYTLPLGCESLKNQSSYPT